MILSLLLLLVDPENPAAQLVPDLLLSQVYQNYLCHLEHLLLLGHPVLLLDQLHQHFQPHQLHQPHQQLPVGHYHQLLQWPQLHQ